MGPSDQIFAWNVLLAPTSALRRGLFHYGGRRVEGKTKDSSSSPSHFAPRTPSRMPATAAFSVDAEDHRIAALHRKIYL